MKIGLIGLVMNELRRRLTDVGAITKVMGSAATASVRALAYADGRRAIRLAFLAGAASNEVLKNLPATLSELVLRCGAERPDRLEAWLRVGLELSELGLDGDRWIVTGRRARAIAADDPFVAPFYRSVAEYHFGAHLELSELIGSHPGRTDLADSAKTIAEGSRLTEHLLAGTISAAIDEVGPSTWLEVGCGSGVHVATALNLQPTLTAVAVDLDQAVVDDAEMCFRERGLIDRAQFRVGDVLDAVRPDERFDVVTLFNNIYYFPTETRAALMDRLSSMVEPGGELIVASQCSATPSQSGSIAAAQLDYILRVQQGSDESLPTIADLEALVANASGVTSIDVHRPVPGEPYVIIRGRSGCSSI